MDAGGSLVPGGPGELATARGYAMPSTDDLLAVWRAMVVGRRFDAQATALTKQGRLAVYPSLPRAGRLPGRPACWRWPSRTGSSPPTATRWPWSPAASTRSRCSPCCAATGTAATTRRPPAPHPSAPRWPPRASTPPGAAYGMRRRGSDGVALCFIGDGATSEGDFHEALNFAAVFKAPAVFFVQNNKYAISRARCPSRPRRRRWPTRASATACAVEQVDGNDPAAVLAVMQSGHRARPLRRRAVPRRGAHLPAWRRTPTPTTPPATAPRTRSSSGRAATRSSGCSAYLRRPGRPGRRPASTR